MLIGYARVSTVGQSLEVQREALLKAGCESEKIYEEKESGKSTDKRDQLQAALKDLRKDDILIVTKLDRLARSMTDLWMIMNELEVKKAGLRVLGQPLIDTTTREGKLVMTMFGYVAETERSLILERTQEGRIKAKGKGVKFGRPQKLTKYEAIAALAELEEGTLSVAKVAEKHGISRATLYRLANS